MSVALGDEHWTRRDTLTGAELRVMIALAENGESNHVIARKINLQPGTVKFHLGNVMRKADVSNRAQLVLWWIRCGRYAVPEEDDRVGRDGAVDGDAGDGAREPEGAPSHFLDDYVIQSYCEYIESRAAGGAPGSDERTVFVVIAHTFREHRQMKKRLLELDPEWRPRRET